MEGLRASVEWDTDYSDTPSDDIGILRISFKRGKVLLHDGEVDLRLQTESIELAESLLPILADAINNYARVKEELLIKETQSAKLLNDYFTLEKQIASKDAEIVKLQKMAVSDITEKELEIETLQKEIARLREQLKFEAWDNLPEEAKMAIEILRKENKELKENELELRKQVWLTHNSKHYLYGDDGEMQCAQCGLDFKRDSVEKIIEKIVSDNMIKVAKQQQEKSEHKECPKEECKMYHITSCFHSKGCSECRRNYRDNFEPLEIEK